MNDFIGQLKTPEAAKQFALAGNATFTLRSKVTGVRFTYRVRQRKGGQPPHFVSLLTGSDNESHYEFIGTIFQASARPVIGGTPRVIPTSFVRGTRSRIGADAPGVQAFVWFWKAMQANVLPDKLEVWHEGKCGRCGRKLTVPESIERGLGPECATRPEYGPNSVHASRTNPHGYPPDRHGDSMDEFNDEIQRREEDEERRRMHYKFLGY